MSVEFKLILFFVIDIMNIKIALTFSALIASEIMLGYSITSLYDCGIEFDYKCYHTLTWYQFGIILIDLILLSFCVSQTIIDEILNDGEILSLVHEYIHERCNEEETEKKLSESSEDLSDDPMDAHPNDSSNEPSILSKRDVDIDKSINDFNEMIMSLVSDTQSEKHPEDESK